MTRCRLMPHPVRLPKRGGLNRRVYDRVEDAGHWDARAAARRAARACLCVGVVLRCPQWQAEHPSRERAAPGVTTHAWNQIHRSRPPGNPERAALVIFRSQLNHADPAQLVEQPSKGGRLGVRLPRSVRSTAQPCAGHPVDTGLTVRRPGQGGTDNSTAGTLAVRCGTPANESSLPTPPCAQDHPWGKRPATTEAGPRGNNISRPGRSPSRLDARRPQGGAAACKAVASARRVRSPGAQPVDAA